MPKKVNVKIQRALKARYRNNSVQKKVNKLRINVQKSYKKLMLFQNRRYLRYKVKII
jgi:hypothetical protein